MADAELVITLNPVHTVTGHATDHAIVRAESTAPIAVRRTWGYVCTCGELGADYPADSAQAMHHIEDVRGPATLSPPSGGMAP